MISIFPKAPAIGTAMPAALPSGDARHLLALRRSAGKTCLTSPGPAPDQMAEILTVAARVPDHRRLGPWRFIIFEGTTRDQFGAAAANIYAADNPDATIEALEQQRSLLLRAPSVIAVISSPDPTHKTPVWEQELSAGALCHNLLLTANAAGWAGCWLTEWIAFHDEINALLGLTEHERVAGYIYLGTATHDPLERMRPDTADRTSYWSPAHSGSE